MNILTLNKIAAIGLDQLDPTKFNHGTEVDNPDAIMVRSADMHQRELGENLKCIARAGAGVNNIPIEQASQKGIVVFNTPGANANAVKELVLCALFLSSRNIVGGIAWARTLAEKGDEVPGLVEKGKSAFVGPEITGKTLGVIGLGAIGVMVANAADQLGMRVLGFDPFLSIDSAWGLSSGIQRARDLKQIFAECDYISLHLPLNKDTRGMMGAEVFETVKPGLRLINMARGDLVDTPALLKALDAGRVASYVTDFPNAAACAHEKIVPIPHLGASTPESEDNCAVMATRQMSDYLLYGNIKNSVNFPDIALEMGQGGARLCVLHLNIPNMLTLIVGELARVGINIENMVNKSKKDLAVSLFDLNQVPPANLKQAIAALDGVLRVRVIE